MAKGIKGITIEIGGNTAPLEKALKDVNKTTKDLQSELRAVDRALKLDPNNVTLVSQKQKILKEEIAATKEKLDILKEAQKQVNEQFKRGEISAEQYRAFQRELESTKAKLASLREEQKSVSVIGAAFENVKNKIAEAASKLTPFINGLKTAGKAAAQITDAGIKTVAGAVNLAEKGLKVYTGTVIAAGTALSGLTVKAAAAADDINTLAAQTGLSTEQIQKFQYASDLIDVPLETLTGSLSRLTRNMANARDGNEKLQAAFAKLGVPITDANGKLRDNEAVFNDVIAALGKVENATERDALAMQIFGRSAQELNPLILGGAETLKKLGDEATKAGLILSQQALDNLNAFNDSMGILRANAGQAGNVLAGVFAGGLKQTTDLIGTMIPQITGSIAQIFSGENMAAAQQKLTNDLINGGKQIISNVAAQLPTFLEGFNAIIISLVTAISALLPDAINTILPTLIDGFTNLIEGLLPQVPVLLPVIINAAVTLFKGLLDGLNRIIPQLLAMLPELIQKVSDTLIRNLPLIIKAGIQLLISLIQGITNAIPQLINAVVALIPVITQAIVNNLPALIRAGIDLIVALARGLPQGIPAIMRALPEIIAAIIDGLTSVNWLRVGLDIIRGIVNGLWQGIRSIDFGRIGRSILNGIKNVLGIRSPSTLFRDVVGKNLALGIGEGFIESMKDVSEEMAAAIPTEFQAPSVVLPNVNVRQTTLANEYISNNTRGRDEMQAGKAPIIQVFLDGRVIAETMLPYVDLLQGRNIKIVARGAGI
ncbi:hypothetical protein KVG29_05180 [Caldicoprobacter algeriensis]|uniref:phage tail protein n=1 Tax=Caldicoprobacter algeriensis TaxID=699281 RepID=UPI0020797AAB|nr:hypothetical protein [Caldicoprobacter algeriensis]MCM8900621.1 hypothetical protein [Caldicoprobacter algeriensis]